MVVVGMIAAKIVFTLARAEEITPETPLVPEAKVLFADVKILVITVKNI